MLTFLGEPKLHAHVFKSITRQVYMITWALRTINDWPASAITESGLVVRTPPCSVVTLSNAEEVSSLKENDIMRYCVVRSEAIAQADGTHMFSQHHLLRLPRSRETSKHESQPIPWLNTRQIRHGRFPTHVPAPPSPPSDPSHISSSMVSSRTTCGTAT